MNLLITRHAQKELDRIPDPMARTITNQILALATNPYPANCKKLQGASAWRLRVGSFRVLYTINTKSKSVTIIRVADRKTVYR